MPNKEKKRSFFARIRNYFITGVVVLIPIGITVYLTIFIIKISSKILPKELNPNHYLPYDIPGVEIVISVVLITFIGWLSLSFIGKKLLDVFNNILKRIPILRTIYSAIGQMTETFTKTDKEKIMIVKREAIFRYKLVNSPHQSTNSKKFYVLFHFLSQSFHRIYRI